MTAGSDVVPWLGPDSGAPLGVPLVDLLDRVLATGVVISGDLVIAIADVPLVRLSLHALLASVSERVPAPLGRRRTAVTGSRVDLDADNAARDLVSLVLTLIELIRQLLERQAVRRLDQADLTPEQEERLGTALMHLDQAMTDLCAHHDLRREDLNLHLGPLGPLLAENPW